MRVSEKEFFIEVQMKGATEKGCRSESDADM
jgi:hypothetical protein